MHSERMEDVVLALNVSIEACQKWKQIFRRISKSIKMNDPTPWQFDEFRIFSTIDAFIQRCSNLHEVCNAQRQFAPSERLPEFGGLHGRHIQSSFKTIFVKSLSLRNA